MGRYIREIKLSQPIDVVSMLVEDYVYHHRFQRNDWNGEMVYYMKDKHGKERYMKWDYTNGVFHVEAWLKDAFGGEADLKGFGSSASKDEFRKSLELLITTLQRQPASSLSSGHVGSDPLHHTSNHAAEHRAQQQGKQMAFGTIPAGKQNSDGNTGSNRNRYAHGSSRNRGNATVSEKSALIYAVIALMFGSIPVIGLLIAITCLRKTWMSKGSTYATARILCIVALIISAITLLTNMILPMFMVPFAEFF